MQTRMSTTERSATAAGACCTQPMPAMSTQMFMLGTAATAAASILLIETGVLASVSLFVLLFNLISLLLVGLVGLLCLSGLTGLPVLVGLIEGLTTPGTRKGD
jgi:hypothetical protein